MRHPNPFSPAFGAAPTLFFGRDAYLHIVEGALANRSDRMRAFFLVSTRGAGKTVLLHQMAKTAQDAHWEAYEMHAGHAAQELYECLDDARHGQARLQVSPKLSLPGGASVSGIDATVEPRGGAQTPLLARALIERCLRMGRHGGVFIAIDEAQKLSETDVEEICVAVQSARTQGCDVMLVLAGLPETKHIIAHYKGCTFMRRAERVVLEVLGKGETRDAFRESFARVPELAVTGDQIEDLAHYSQGHPYLVQLLGHYVYEVMSEQYDALLEAGVQTVTPAVSELEEAKRRAMWEYCEDVLEPVVQGMRTGMLAYLKALCSTMDERGLLHTGADLAAKLGKADSHELSYYRQRTIDLCIAKPVGRGTMRFLLPYVPRAFAQMEMPAALASDDSWDMEVR